MVDVINNKFQWTLPPRQYSKLHNLPKWVVFNTDVDGGKVRWNVL